MAVAPFPIHVKHGNKWITLQSDELVAGGIVSVVPQQTETTVPADILLVAGTCIVHEAMLSGVSTPSLLKDTVELQE
ncbi:hypothetical protein BDY19DRAFT_998439 [Irpex rosettiformis]|uniref:Uncharacterized protein n=1 Tax=Irpex rosettiformis TaxID=378272 RepID=A0ACB8TNM3_9APHY|nr:hypothetical protein BDY19DRAFT_998439 [Irpex rosettiformis]